MPTNPTPISIYFNPLIAPYSVYNRVSVDLCYIVQNQLKTASKNEN